MPTYAITGASGQLGQLVVEQLLTQGVTAPEVVALVRTSGKAADLAELGVQVREADYSRPQTLGAALAGVDRLLLISSSEAGQRVVQHTNVIEAAATADVSRIVYTSMLDADHSTNPLAQEHRDTEHALREAGLPHTVLRNGWYTENYTDQLDQYVRTSEIVGAAGDGKVSAATRQDYAAAAAAALLQDEAGNRTYELGGPAFDLTDLACVISEVTGTSVSYRDLPVEEYVSWLQEAGLDEDNAHFTVTCKPTVRTWNNCWATPRRHWSMSSARHTAQPYAVLRPVRQPSGSSAPDVSAPPWPLWLSAPVTTSCSATAADRKP